MGRCHIGLLADPEFEPNGRARRHWASPEMWVTCALGPYNFEFMTSVHKEIVARYPIDGIFINRWAGSGMCYCEHCQANFRAASGRDLPRSGNPQDAAQDRKSTRLNSSHATLSRMPSSA